MVHRLRQLEAVLALAHANLRADGEADVDQRLVVGLRGGLERRIVGDDRPEREQRGDRRQQQAQQVRAQASCCYLYSSSM
jgi:hypothetical protein